METASLYQGLTFLAWTSVVFLVVVGVFIVKVLYDFSKLIELLNQTATLVRSSAEPILSDVTESVGIINKMVKKTETNVSKFKNVSGRFSKIALDILSKTSVLSGFIAKNLFKGICGIIKSLKK